MNYLTLPYKELENEEYAEPNYTKKKKIIQSKNQ